MIHGADSCLEVELISVCLVFYPKSGLGQPMVTTPGWRAIQKAAEAIVNFPLADKPDRNAKAPHWYHTYFFSEVNQKTLGKRPDHNTFCTF